MLILSCFFFLFFFSYPNIDTSSKFRIHWQSRDLTATEECAVQIPYEGTPFVYIGEKAYMCHLGRNKATKDKDGNKETAVPPQVCLKYKGLFMLLFFNNFFIGILFYSFLPNSRAFI